MLAGAAGELPQGIGILRLIVEQRADCEARGWWQGEHFCLFSKLSREDIEASLLEQYEPTPLLSPWNKGCGFSKPNDPGLAPLEQIRTRLDSTNFRQGITESRRLLDTDTEADAVIRAIKARTKTNKTFQSEQQRKLLAKCETFRSCLRSARTTNRPAPEVPARKTALELGKRILRRTESACRPARCELENEGRSGSTQSQSWLQTHARRQPTADSNPEGSANSRLSPHVAEPHAEWLSAAVVLNEDGNPEWPSLLGTGGNDGNLDFTNNSCNNWPTVRPRSAAGGSNRGASELLANSLWSEPANKLSATVGQYQPGAAGGAQQLNGIPAANLVNPWDFVLMMEGSLLFSRGRLGVWIRVNSAVQAPLCRSPSRRRVRLLPVRKKPSAASNGCRLWSRPATLAEVVALFGEARVQLNRQTANRPVDVARAISRLGVARGIECLYPVRIPGTQRPVDTGRSSGRVNVRQHPRVRPNRRSRDYWMDQMQRRARTNAPEQRVIQAERRLADAVFAALTHDYSPDRWQGILRAAVAVESLQATGTAIEAGRSFSARMGRRQ